MNQECPAHLMHAQTATIVELKDRISTHETIRCILRMLALGDLIANQAIDIPAETAAHSGTPKQRARGSFHAESLAAITRSSVAREAQSFASLQGEIASSFG